MAANNADNPQGADPPTLRAEREACGLADLDFDRSVADSLSDGMAITTSPARKS